MQNIDVDSKYQIKSEIDHILSRPGMYVGSISTDIITYPLFIPSKNKIQYIQNTGYNAGLIKLIDEVLSNSVDEHRATDSLHKVTKIEVTVNKDGFVQIKDNGGIPVKKHKVGVLVPELIFGTLRSSSNYDDTQQRDKVGTNGVGVKIANIFSKKFSVYTCDGKNCVTLNWSNNMRELDKQEEKFPLGFEVKECNINETIISFNIDLEKFDIAEMFLSFIRIIQKRCIDAAAANPQLEIVFKTDMGEGKLDSIWQFPSFEDYVKLYLTDEQIPQLIKYSNSKKDLIYLLPDSIGYNIGFVNGALCCEGTHIKKIQTQITDKILDYCKKNEMELLTDKDILNRITLFVNTTIYNPVYDSQTKEKLASKIDKNVLLLNNDYLESLLKSKLFENLQSFYELKFAEEKKKELRKLNSIVKSTKVKKLITSVSSDENINELWIFEGDSAGSGFRKARNLYQSAYLLRGKITNTFTLSRNQILENQEIREVIATLNLTFNDPKANLKNCKFAKIIFATDMDHDGNHICGLLITFFAKHFPELFKANKICRALSPIIVANPEGVLKKQGKESLYYYSLEEFERKNDNLKGYDVIYTKGLGGLSDHDYKQMLRNQKLIQFTLQDVQDLEAINIWFDKSTDMRKELLLLEEQRYINEEEPITV